MAGSQEKGLPWRLSEDGRDITSSLQEEISEEDRRAREKALSLLLAQERSARDLQNRLCRSGFSEKAAGQAVSYVQQLGYLDDQRFACNYVRFRKGKKSRRELQMKLSEKGVDRELISLALEEYTKEEETEALLIQLQKRLKGRNFREMDMGERQKLKAAVARKGYPVNLIQTAISTLEQGEE